jgi:hypothetical protein
MGVEGAVRSMVEGGYHASWCGVVHRCWSDPGQPTILGTGWHLHMWMALQCVLVSISVLKHIVFAHERLAMRLCWSKGGH